MVQFRKSKKVGPFRVTATKKGLGFSAGAGPVRISRGADGKTRRTLRVPGAGIYDTKVVSGGRKKQQSRRRQQDPSAQQRAVTPTGPGGKARKPWYRWKSIWILFGLILLVWMLPGDDDDEATTDEPASPTEQAKERPTPEERPLRSEAAVESWAGAPQDGTWEYGDVSFGEWSEATGVREYAYMIDTPPTFTEDGDRVTVSSQINVRRVEDRGWGEPLSEDMTVYFSSGGHQEESGHIDEAYGDADVVCEQDQLAEGETTTCKVTFTPRYPDEIQDFHWSVDRESVGTWPSQVSSD